MEDFMITLLICSVTMSALALMYLAVTPLLAKRYSYKSLYYAWLIIVIGLIIPFRPQFSNALVKVDMPGNMIVPFPPAGGDLHAAATISNVPPPAAPHIAWWQVMAAVWLVGMIFFLAYHIIRHTHFLKLTAHWSENITDEQTLMLFRNLKSQMGISKNIGLQVCGCIGSPMMIGFTKPRILLPEAAFAKDELHFILKHELVHYKRRDLWYKGLMLTATAVHWFNPIVQLMSKEINRQCELSCDAEVVRSTGADTRLCYSETIIGVVRYKSKLKTALSTNFYGGKKGMKNRIFSIMDTSKKKAGAIVLCGAMILTMGTGFAFKANAADAETQTSPIAVKEPTALSNGIPIAMIPDPDIYAPYAAYGITISEDGTKLLYEGQPVRLFEDDSSDKEAFYMDGTGSLNLSVVRNASGRITGIESITLEKAQEYYEKFFTEELTPGFLEKVNNESIEIVNESIQEGEDKYKKYQSFGITYSEADGILYLNGQRVKFFIDQTAGNGADALWIDEAGTVNAVVTRDVSGQITGIESISDQKAQDYQSANDEYEQNILNGLEDRIEAKFNR